MDTGDPYPGRVAHWVRHNSVERIPHRWIVADTEARTDRRGRDQVQTLRCGVAVRWCDDPRRPSDDEWGEFTTPGELWSWVAEHVRRGARTIMWFHNVGYDLRTAAAFTELPALGFQLEWCNLDRDASVVSWRSDRGALVIADTWTWLAKPLAEVAGMVGIPKPKLPAANGSDAAWLARCRADVEITAQAVRELVGLVRDHHLGNWQPSGAGMGYAMWRHNHLDHKVLVHNDAPALEAERAAMHAGRAEAWWHGKADGGPFADWDCHMSYPRIAAECAVPVKLWAYDGKPTKTVHEWARQHWAVLCRVEVDTDVPVVPHHTGERIIWPVGRFETTLWQPELDLIRSTGGTYRVLEQWRYNLAPALKSWAKWSMWACDSASSPLTPVQRTWAKHQSRAMIGRLALRLRAWEQWGANPDGRCGLSDLLDISAGTTTRLMHVGDRTFAEGERREASSSLPQITGWIMSVARVRLWEATVAAGQANVLHIDTDSLITNAAGSARMTAAVAAGLPGGWRRKTTHRRLRVIGPRHYRTAERDVLPGVPRTATEREPGVWVGEIWQSLAGALEDGTPGQVRITEREYRPREFDPRRPTAGTGPAHPIRLG